MNKLLIVIAAIMVIIVVIHVLFDIYMSFRHRLLTKIIIADAKPLYLKLKKKQYLTQEDIDPYMDNPLTRESTFQLLRYYNKIDLFPKMYYNLEKRAESHLVFWLKYISDIKACPDEIKLVKKVVIDSDKDKPYYYVFKFRYDEPHAVAKEGWMYGVTGEYYDNISDPTDDPELTFSRYSKEGTISPEDEALWFHEEF